MNKKSGVFLKMLIGIQSGARKHTTIFLSALAFFLTMGLTLSAGAGYLDYGGTIGVRAYSVHNFADFGDDESTIDDNLVDSMMFLWGRYHVNDELSWTNTFRFNWILSTPKVMGGVGSQGSGDYIQWRHSFVDYKPRAADPYNLNFRVGLQPYEAARGMLFNDDYLGGVVSHENQNMKLSLVWMKVFENTDIIGETVMAEGFEDEDLDLNFFGLTPEFYTMGGNLTIKPSVFYMKSRTASEGTVLENIKELDLYYYGGEIEYKAHDFDIWALGFYQNGKVKSIFDTTPTFEFDAYLAAVGAEYRFDDLGVHGEAFYASGEDKFNSKDMSFFYIPQGQSYYWSEIMGLGYYDDYISRNSPGAALSNIAACNLGFSYKFTSALKLTGDVWYATLAEKTPSLPEKELGTEVDLRVDYRLNENTLLSATAAYLFAGDATTYEVEDDADPWLIGMRFLYTF